LLVIQSRLLLAALSAAVGLAILVIAAVAALMFSGISWASSTAVLIVTIFITLLFIQRVRSYRQPAEPSSMNPFILSCIGVIIVFGAALLFAHSLGVVAPAPPPASLGWKAGDSSGVEESPLSLQVSNAAGEEWRAIFNNREIASGTISGTSEEIIIPLPTSSACEEGRLVVMLAGMQLARNVDSCAVGD